MLVLTRKLGERVFIGEDIAVVVVDVDRGKVRLGIEAPRGVAIFREEVLRRGRQVPPEAPPEAAPGQ